MMRVQALVLGVVLAGAAMPVAAQQRHVGLKAGLNAASISSEGDSGTGYEDRRVAFLGGGFAVLPLTRYLAVQIEGLFSQKGGDLTDDATGAKATLELDYLDFPMLARITGPAFGDARLHLFAGPSLSYRMGARNRLTLVQAGGSGGVVDNIENDVKRFGLGMVVGAGADIGRRLVVDARYSWGLSHLNRDTSTGVDIRNRVLSIMGGVRF